jgi:hypothetical protein
MDPEEKNILAEENLRMEGKRMVKELKQVIERMHN